MSVPNRLLAPRVPGLVLTVLLVGCSSTYYSVMESFGVEKRDILADRVVEGRDDQELAKEQFRTTYETFKELTGFEGGDLEATHDRLRTEFSRCEALADDVRERIDSIEDVAAALFSEWEAEAEEYGSAELRSSSLKMLKETRGRYEQLISAMRRSEKTMDPVLEAFGDQVLYLKHHLNAQAIASLSRDVVALEDDVAALIAEMEASIREADAFIDTLG
jgi:hypothetical protein